MPEQVSIANSGVPTAPAPAVHTIRHFKAPPFLEDKIKVWFMLLEANFNTAHITNDESKYCHTLSSLTTKAINQVEDVIVAPPEANKYENLKEKMIERFTESDSSRMKKLMENEQMGDRKPSEFFRCLKSYGTSNTTDAFIMSVWKTRLPPTLQAHLTVTSETETAKLLKLADSVHEVNHSPAKQINAVEHHDGLAMLSEQIKNLILQISTRDQGQGRSRSRNRGNKNNRSQTPANNRAQPTSESNGRLYYYHHNFKEKATKCRSGCSWSGNNARSQ
ncbi:uncharacterized protein LOC131672450 [Phymastichus coffea]|uniref:uncharacterized protein LOC131672450 n=1 Tax=Phymastichus coffea TaxID=108790 RepID=UPI00273B4A72|nr:uncharacterized protein LOC131672450 [Phymastichus coffea]